MNINKLYYLVKPLLPRAVQIGLRRRVIEMKLPRYDGIWPIDERSASPPSDWTGWPDQKRFAVVLTHDVELAKGQARCEKLLRLEQQHGFVSSFNFVPERYDVSPEVRDMLTRNGFEVGVHGLKHDGKLYQTRETFAERAVHINRYLKEWGAVGFRSPAMHHNLDWLQDLDIEYDLSTFDTDPFEPQADGMGTIFPFYVEGTKGRTGYLELPYTLVQDFTLLVLMNAKSIDIWKRKVDWLVEHGGMVLVNVHPDYMAFDGDKPSLEEFPAELYAQLLDYIRLSYAGEYWHGLPKDLTRQLMAARRAQTSPGRQSVA